METSHSCPECHLIFEAELPVTGVLVCPLCNSVFSAQPPVSPIPVLPSLLPSMSSGRQVLRGVLAVGAALLLVGGIGYAYHLFGGINHKAAIVPAPVARVAPAPETPHPVELMPIIPEQPPPLDAAQQPQPLPQPPQQQSLMVRKEVPPPLSLPERINRAIDRGVAYLRDPRKAHAQDRRIRGLLGLTLLECGISAEDPSVQQLAASIRTGQLEITQTYELTLAILFLDRLGDPSDRALIRTLGQRLLYGQLACGAWSYSCLVNERQRFRNNSSYGLPYVPPLPYRHRVVRYGGRPAREQRIAYHGDNSNTQFAILGLWVAQRHGVPGHSALLATEQYFRNTQFDDGSWGYHPNARNARDSMTCAGLTSLAMRYGIGGGQGRDIRPDHPISVHDADVLRGLRYLEPSLDKITILDNRIKGVEARDPLYFLWSLERVAAIYDLKKIGEREWYPWAAQLLVETQQPCGRWLGMGDPVGTCFALLVLKRSNLAKDLQLAVRERPPRARPDISGPIILQGPDVFLGQTIKPHPPAPPIGQSITLTPQTK
jgi:hypothetical protein